jgi:hypothetical protein
MIARDASATIELKVLIFMKKIPLTVETR